MKRMMRSQDGYILAYVLVIVLVVSLIAVAACTTAVRNHSAQHEALQYTKNKYDVEGAMERFVAELRVELAEAAKTVYTQYEEETDKSYAVIVGALQTEIDYALLGNETEGKVGIIPGIEKNQENPAYHIEVQGKNLDDEEEGFVFYNEQDAAEDSEHTTHSGYFPMEITVCISKNGIEVKAVVNVIFNAIAEKDQNNKWNYTVTGAAFEYASYGVSTVQVTPEGGAS